MDNRPIGIFDSGLGGLTVVKQLLKYLPDENIVYFGDTGRVPYGTRSRDIIYQYAKQDINFLCNCSVKLIIAACGTVSSVAPHAADNCGVPFIGVVEPAAKAAVKITKNKRIGVLGTQATVNSGSYEKFIKRFDPDVSVYQQACNLFVPLVENGWIGEDDIVVKEVARRYLTPLTDAGVDTIILGCTHYPVLEPVIKRIVGESITLINMGEATSERAKRYLTEQDMLCDKKEKVERRFFVSDKADSFSQMAQILLGSDIDFDVKKIDIERY